jgi:hypothetical protein
MEVAQTVGIQPSIQSHLPQLSWDMGFELSDCVKIGERSGSQSMQVNANSFVLLLLINSKV